MTITETKPREQTMPADALISPWLLLANRDERELPTPTGLKIHRSPQSPPGLRSRHPLLHQPATNPGEGENRGKCAARRGAGVLPKRTPDSGGGRGRTCCRRDD